ncbi:hypothetical protein M493_08480 [Geobacillus genomosp. 3]|uniref:Uncharacterized protein n=1 Tax=Geobacillus genomosp. 3 TaxID=1921421 RepID=S5YZ46_GEOG3|nr:hypothetical protein M493_08480 [Geobacillus genomosp. 3]
MHEQVLPSPEIKIANQSEGLFMEKPYGQRFALHPGMNTIHPGTCVSIEKTEKMRVSNQRPALRRRQLNKLSHTAARAVSSFGA